MITFKSAHVTEALGHLITLLRSGPNTRALLSAWVRQVQDLEDVFAELYTERWLDNAVGLQLDNFGSVVGEFREGRPDDEYRFAIRTRINLNISSATIEDIIGLLYAISNSNPVNLQEYDWCAIIAALTDPLDPVLDPATLVKYLRIAKAAGVRAILTYVPATPFSFDTGPGYDDGLYGGAIE